MAELKKACIYCCAVTVAMAMKYKKRRNVRFWVREWRVIRSISSLKGLQLHLVPFALRGQEPDYDTSLKGSSQLSSYCNFVHMDSTSFEELLISYYKTEYSISRWVK